MKLPTNRKVNIYEEANRCLLCQDAPCTKACKTGDPARAIRAIRFDNHKPALLWVKDCSDEDLERAEEACIHYNWPIRIKEIIRAINPDDVDNSHYPSLAISFCGIKCENPFFLASSAVCTNYEMVASAFRAGWAGVFYKTICMQEIKEVSPRFDAIHTNATHGDFYGFRNMEQLSENPVEMDFDILRRLKHDFPTKVVVASIMGQTEEQWQTLARMAEEAGCDAVELNFSCPQMKHKGMGSDVGQSAELVNTYTACVKRSVKIPVIPKMTPNITHIEEPAMACIEAGADAISAINTIKSVTMDVDAEVAGQRTISGYSGQRHWRHRDMERRPGVYPVGLPQRAGMYGRDAVWLPHHRRPDAGHAALSGQAGPDITRRPGGRVAAAVYEARHPEPRHHHLSEVQQGPVRRLRALRDIMQRRRTPGYHV